MGQKCLTYNSLTKLKADLPATIGVCVESYLLAPRLCPNGTSEQPFEYHSFDAVVVDAKYKPPSKCGGTAYYQYTICFDEDVVAEGQEITASDILGIFALNCEGTYWQDAIGNEIQLNENEDGSLTLVSQHGCEYTFFPGEAVPNLSTFLTIDLNSAGQQVKNPSAAGTVYNYYFFNTHEEDVVYVKMYDQAAAPDPAQDIPFKVFPLPPLSGANLAADAPIPFTNGLWVRAVTGVADANVTDPATNQVIANIDYE